MGIFEISEFSNLFLSLNDLIMHPSPMDGLCMRFISPITHVELIDSCEAEALFGHPPRRLFPQLHSNPYGAERHGGRWFFPISVVARRAAQMQNDGTSPVFGRRRHVEIIV